MVIGANGYRIRCGRTEFPKPNGTHKDYKIGDMLMDRSSLSLKAQRSRTFRSGPFTIGGA